ncbi:hypothetical protein MLD38_006260 [Melastoma candidum]|uniref:Uncharacterized protein n=2 Tax=Melastoma candidum TaxID=119954 RepID=A0ACB9RLN5_9MYRT|nr:hypothetical protein MLD38_006260 [Melastoma candidum]
MLRVWRWYQSCLANHPVKTQVISSGVLWGVGDVAAQYITHSTTVRRLQISEEDPKFKFKVDTKRVAITSTFGFGFVGPLGHFWYQGLDRFIRLKLKMQPRSARFVATKLAIDGVIVPLDLLIFFSYMGFSAGKNAEQVKKDLKRDFLPALVMEGGIWPLFQVVNFQYVPVRYQLLYVNMLCLLDSAFLSWLEQQKDASWKQWFSSFHSLKEGGQGR